MHSADTKAFSAWNRFHQTLTAMAQDDVDGVQHLRDTCPRVSENLPDPDYRSLVDGTEKWVVVAALDMVAILARLDMLHDLAPLWDQMVSDTTPRRRRRDHAIIRKDFLTHMQRQLLGQLRAFWEALGVVCTTLIETDIRIVLQAEYPPLLASTTRYEAAWQQVPRNEEQYATHLETLTALWLRFCDPPMMPLKAQH